MFLLVFSLTASCLCVCVFWGVLEVEINKSRAIDAIMTCTLCIMSCTLLVICKFWQAYWLFMFISLMKAKLLIAKKVIATKRCNWALVVAFSKVFRQILLRV